MNTDLCIGISSKDSVLEIAALKSGQPGLAMIFPATGMGLEAIKIFLAGYGNPVRLAVTGVAALTVALTLGDITRYEVFIVSPTIASQPVALAQYAQHAV